MLVADIPNRCYNHQVRDEPQSALFYVIFKFEKRLSRRSRHTTKERVLPGTLSNLAVVGTAAAQLSYALLRRIPSESNFLSDDERRSVFNTMDSTAVLGRPAGSLDASPTFVSAREQIFFLCAQRGTVKTCVASEHKHSSLKSQRKYVLISTSCATAAQLFGDDQTGHLAFKNPFAVGTK